MNELAKKRADVAGDSRLWSPEDALEDLLNEIKAGRIKPTQLAIHYFEGTPETGMKHDYSAAGLTFGSNSGQGDPNHVRSSNSTAGRASLRERSCAAVS